MAARKKYDAVATVGTYKDRQTGEEKKRYANVGTVFESDDGRLSLKLDTVPVGPGWSGYIQFFEPDRERGAGDRKEAPRNMSVPSNRQQAQKSSGQAPADDDDFIPF